MYACVWCYVSLTCKLCTSLLPVFAWLRVARNESIRKARSIFPSINWLHTSIARTYSYSESDDAAFLSLVLREALWSRASVPSRSLTSWDLSAGTSFWMWVCVCVPLYVCLHVYIYIHTYIYVCISCIQENLYLRFERESQSHVVD